MTPEELARLYFNRGIILFQGMNEPGRALYNFEKSLEINPGYSQAEEIRKTVMGLQTRGVQPVSDEPPPKPAQPAAPGSTEPAPPAAGPASVPSCG